MRQSDGGLLHPIVAGMHDAVISEGMSLRDYFAGQALVGLLSEAWHPDMGYSPAGSAPPSRTAAQAYEFADAMIRAKAAIAKAEEGL